MQARKFEQVIAAQNIQLNQKTALLGSQLIEMQRLERDKQCLSDKIQEMSNQVQVQELQAQLSEAVQQADALRDVAHTHGKESSLLKAQATALQMKLKQVQEDKRRLENACSLAQSAAEVCHCEFVWLTSYCNT